MAGNGRRKEQTKIERLTPGVEAVKSSRVSRAAGSVGSSSVRMASQSSPGNRSRMASSPGGRGAQRAGGAKAPARKGAGASSSSRKGAANVPAMPADSRMIQQVRQKWEAMQPHEQQRFFSIVLLLLSIFLLFALTFWHTQPLFQPLSNFFTSLFSWAEIPFCLGLIAFAVAHLIEGARNIRFIRWSLVLGLAGLLVL